MENATKALLIAAAVLVAILIISLGLVVYNMAAETMDSVNISGQEVTASNEKFTRYDGAHRRGSEVNAMLKTVLSANRDAEEAGEEAVRAGGPDRLPDGRLGTGDGKAGDRQRYYGRSLSHS